MRIAVIGDIHVTEARLDGLGGQRPILEEVVAEIGVADPDVVLVAGDLAGQTVPHKCSPRERDVIVSTVLGLSWEGRLGRSFRPVVIVRGNHDYPMDYGFLNRLHGEVVYVDDPEFLNVAGARVLCLPWIDRAAVATATDDEYRLRVVEIYREAVEGSKADLLAGVGPRIVLAHAAFEGGVLREGQPSVPTKDPVIPTSIFPADLFDLVVGGHYHLPQALDSKDGSAPGFYVGSLFVNRFGEHPAKSWVMLDDESGTLVAKRHPVQQPARIRLDIDAVTGGVIEIVGGTKAMTTLGDPARVADSIRAAGVPCHVKIVPHVHEHDLGTARVKVAEVRTIFAEVALTTVIGVPEVVRIERKREGADEVAEARGLAEKIAAWVTTLDEKPGKRSIARAVEILGEIEAEVDGGAT
jgi:DNA repair exonuclease SbcCD nuclease subunit